MNVLLGNEQCGSRRTSHLFVGDLGDHKLSGQRNSRSRQGNAGHDLRSDACLVVACASTINSTVENISLKWCMAPSMELSWRYDIEMSIETENWFAYPERRYEIWPGVVNTNRSGFESMLLELGFHDRSCVTDIAGGIDRWSTHD